jgi:hypothetical protein
MTNSLCVNKLVSHGANRFFPGPDWVASVGALAGGENDE